MRLNNGLVVSIHCFRSIFFVAVFISACTSPRNITTLTIRKKSSYMMIMATEEAEVATVEAMVAVTAIASLIIYMEDSLIT